MNDPRIPRFFYLFLFALALIMCAHYYPQMPQRMASHFAADGHVNGWQSREAFFVLMIVILSVSSVVGFLAPRQIASRPDARINLPNKEYWLAPERRAETFGFISAMMGWFSCGLLLVLIAGTFLAIQANLAAEHTFDSKTMLIVMGGFLLFVMTWLIHFIRHFRRVISDL